MKIKYIRTTTGRIHVCFQTIILYGYSFAKGYNTNTLRISCFYATFCGERKHVLLVKLFSTFTTVISRNGIIVIAWVSSPLQRQRLGSNRRGYYRGPLTGWLFNDSVIFCRLFFLGSFICFWLWGRSCGLSTTELRRVYREDFQAVIKRDICSKVDWTWRAHCMASSVAGSNYNRIFPEETPEGARLCSSHLDFKQLWQQSMPACLACSWDCCAAYCRMPWNWQEAASNVHCTYEMPRG
jgi:hypothetical protein